MEDELRLLGLNDVDIKVFLTLLELGESSASEISKKTELPRTSVYDVLERLEKKGLVSHILRNYKKHYLAAEPNTIIENLEYKKEKIKDILPKLNKIKNQEIKKPIKTEIYEGKKGLQTVMNLILEEKELFVIGASRKSSEVLPYFLEKWHKERARRKIKVKIIYNDLDNIRKALKKTKIKKTLGVNKGWNYKFLHTDYLSPIMTLVFGERVALVNWTKEHPSAILIESKDIAETNKQYILNLWKIAEK